MLCDNTFFTKQWDDGLRIQTVSYGHDVDPLAYVHHDTRRGVIYVRYEQGLVYHINGLDLEFRQKDL